MAVSENELQRVRDAANNAAVAAHAAPIADASVAVAAPTKAEFDAVVGKLNSALAALRTAGIVNP